MRNRVPYRLLMAAIAASAFMGSAVRAFSDDGYLLRRVYKVGDTDKFKTTLKVESGNGAVKLDILVLTTETVKEVRPDGATVLRLKVDKAVRSTGGQETVMADDGRETILIIDKTGRIQPADKADPGNSVVIRLLSLARLDFLPDKPLKAGDEHKFESKIEESGKPSFERKGSVKVVGIDKKSADIPIETIKVKIAVDSTLPSDDGEQKAHVDASANIEPGSGKPVTTSGKITGLKNKNIGEVTIDFNVQRILSDKPAKDGGDK